MKKYSRIIFVLAGILVLVIALTVGANIWIKHRLPGIINENNNSSYQITYKDISVSLLNRNIIARDIVILPRKPLESGQEKLGFFGEIPSVKVKNFSYWDLLRENRIKAGALVITQPKATLFQPANPARDEARKTMAALDRIIYVRDFYMHEGSLQLYRGGISTLVADSVSLQVEGILVSPNTLKNIIPIEFKSYRADCRAISYRINRNYEIRGNRFALMPHKLGISNVKLLPLQNRRNFIASIPREKDQFTITMRSLVADSLQWGFYENEGFFARTKALTLSGLNANIYRGKMAPDDPTRKKMYGELLREIPFEMKVGVLKMISSRIEYEEEKDFDHGAGKVFFSNFYMTATGVASTLGRTKMPDVSIDVQCRFMGAAPMKTHWTFNPLDKTDRFNIRGSIMNFPAGRISPFTKPYVNADFSGELEEVYFDFSGNADGAWGDFAVNYDDLKVKVYRKKDRKKKNKFLTAIANLFVKNDTKDKVTQAEVRVDRLKDRSFFNLLWRAVADGLKQILI